MNGEPNESLISQSQEKPKLLITIDKVNFTPKYESSIPENITTAILRKEQLPNELPILGSSMIEDFIIRKFNQGISNSTQIAEKFNTENVIGSVKKYIEQVKSYSKKLNWEEIFSINDVEKVRKSVCQEMKTLGMTDQQITKIQALNINITEDIGTSTAAPQNIESVDISRLQVIRRAIDYTRVFGNTVPFEQVIKTIMATTIGHELGHKVDQSANHATSRISSDISWEKNSENHENKSERFAEYWASVTEDIPTKKINQHEWLIQVNKVAQLWDVIHNYNQSHEYKADLMDIFRKIDEKINDSDVAALFDARKQLYNNNEVENYASPYTKDIVAISLGQAYEDSNLK